MPKSSHDHAMEVDAHDASNEMYSEDDNDLSTLSFLRDQRLQRHESDVNFKTLTDTAANKLPNEALVDTMKFLNRDDLDVLQLTAAKFDLLVAKYFDVFPLRKVETCKVITKKDKTTRLRMICRVPQRMIESDSDIHFWLRNCTIDRIIFTNFRFTDRLVSELCALKPGSLTVNNCIFNYQKRCPEKSVVPVSEHQLRHLFSAQAFLQCSGTIFCFRLGSIDYRPSLSSILSLPLRTLVIDFEGYVTEPEDLKLIAAWLHDENTQYNCGQVSNFGASKSLSVKGIVFIEEHFDEFVDILRKKFLYDTTKRSYVFETDYDLDREYNETIEVNERPEKFSVFYDFETRPIIERS